MCQCHSQDSLLRIAESFLSCIAKYVNVSGIVAFAKKDLDVSTGDTDVRWRAKSIKSLVKGNDAQERRISCQSPNRKANGWLLAYNNQSTWLVEQILLACSKVLSSYLIGSPALGIIRNSLKYVCQQ